MRVGGNLLVQNYPDWDRFEAEERGEDVASRPETPDRAIFLEEVELAVQMDALGFDSVWTIEHHFTPYTMVTNPLQLLTYLAGVTRNVDLGSDVVVLPWHNPVRVAEDVNMLDALLGPDRNIMCGVGRGLGRREYQGLSVDQNEARGRFDEGLKIVHQLLKTGHCTHDGEFWQPKDVRLRPQPERDLSGQLYCAGGTSETTEIIARYDVKPLAIPTSSLDQALGGVRNYANLRQAAGHDPVHTKLALWTHVCDNAADAKPRPGIRAPLFGLGAPPLRDDRHAPEGDQRLRDLRRQRRGVARQPRCLPQGISCRPPHRHTRRGDRHIDRARHGLRRRRVDVHLQVRRTAAGRSREERAAIRRRGDASAAGTRPRAAATVPRLGCITALPRKRAELLPHFGISHSDRSMAKQREMKTRTPHHYTQCGLGNVYLRNGFEVVSTKYGEAIRIHDMDGLHGAIGMYLIREKKTA